VLGVGVAANASFSAAFAGIPTTAVAMRADYHLDINSLGMVLGLLGLGVAISELPWGLLTDRWGDRRVLLLGLASTALALALMAVFVVPSGSTVPGMASLAGGMLLLGLLGGSVNGSSGRAIMAWFAARERGFAMSIRQTAVPVGGAIGALLLPFLAPFGFVWIFGVLAALCAVTTILTWVWVREPPERAAQTLTTPTNAKSPLRDTLVWRLALGIGILGAPQICVVTFGTVFLHDFLGAATWLTSASLIAVQLGAAVMRVWSGRWTDRHDNRRAYLRFCSVMSAAIFLLLAVTVTLPGQHAVVIVALLVVGGIIASAWHGVAYAELATRAGAAQSGTALGLGNTFMFISFFVVPLSVPVLMTAGTWMAVWVLGGVASLVAVALFPAPLRRLAASAA
jgi:MFS family permease